MDPEDFFYSSIKWQEKFNELSKLEMTLMAIIALLNCPNNSCRTNVLFEKALKHFKIRTSRGPKKEFRISFNKILKNLISKKVFKEYNKTKIPRVKINELEQRDNFHKLLRRYHTSYFNKSQSQITFIKDTSSKKNDFISNVTEDESLSINIENSENLTQDFNSDDVSNKFLNDLLDDGIPELESEQDTQKVPEQNISISDIKEKIKSHYEKIDVIDIKEVYPDYKLIVNGDVLDIEILIEFKLKNNVQLKCFIDFFPDAAIEILKLFGKNNFNATICVEDFHLKNYYIIKQNIDTSIFEAAEIISIIDSLIKTARYTTQLIAKFL